MTDYNDGNWHGWNGGECPVHPKSEVRIWDANSLQDLTLPAECVHWSFRGAFRVVTQHIEPRKWWLVKNGSSYWAFNSAREAKTAYPGCAPIHVKEITE